jgi:hypothetical protein
VLVAVPVDRGDPEGDRVALVEGIEPAAGPEVDGLGVVPCTDDVRCDVPWTDGVCEAVGWTDGVRGGATGTLGGVRGTGGILGGATGTGGGVTGTGGILGGVTGTGGGVTGTGGGVTGTGGTLGGVTGTGGVTPLKEVDPCGADTGTLAGPMAQACTGAAQMTSTTADASPSFVFEVETMS